MGILIFNNGRASGVYSNGQYTGEKIPGDLAAWNILNSNSNDFLLNSYGLLSDRSQTLYHTYSPVISAVDKQTDYAIGSGLVFRSQPDWSMIPWLKKNKAKDLGKEIQKIVHYYFQKFNFYEKQRVLFTGALTLGDSLLFFDRKNGELVDLVEFQGNEIQWEYKKKNYKLGIMYDDMYRRIGFRSVGGKDILFLTPNGNQNVLQFYIKKQPRQVRGYPLAYAVINLAKNDDRHQEAIIQRAVLESILVGSYETETSSPFNQTSNLAEANVKKTAGTSSTSGFLGGIFNKITNAFQLGAGNMYTFRKGENIKFTDLKAPAKNYGDFKEWIINYIGMATGTPPEVILSKYNTSYTAHKGALNDFRKSYEIKRKSFERNVMYSCVREIVKDALIKRYITLPGFFTDEITQRAYLQGNYLGPIPGHINPLQEITAAEKAVSNAFELRSDVTARFGNEYDNMIEEWHEEEEEWSKTSNDDKNNTIKKQELDNGQKNKN